jgi:hypothetical protein
MAAPPLQCPAQAAARNLTDAIQGHKIVLNGSKELQNIELECQRSKWQSKARRSQ